MTREEFMEAAGKRYDGLHALNDGRDFYDCCLDTQLV
jgi:hypothetical protein